MEQHNPPYPAQILRDDVLPALGLTVTQAADLLGVGRPAVSYLLNGHSGLSPGMALRIERVFGLDAKLMLRMQTNHDLWHERKKLERALAALKRYQPLAPYPGPYNAA